MTAAPYVPPGSNVGYPGVVAPESLPGPAYTPAPSATELGIMQGMATGVGGTTEVLAGVTAVNNQLAGVQTADGLVPAEGFLGCLTGLAQSAMSSFFVRRMHHHTQQPMPWKHWLKWLTVVDVDRQLILAQSARQGPWNDCANLPSLVAEAHRHTPVGCVLADAEFDSERNHTFCRQQLKADSIIPAKRFTSRRATGVRGQMRENFPRERYAKRSLIETVFSVAKRKLSCRATGRTVAMQTRQALLLGVAYNLYRLWLPA